jgi:hypothetical protein
LREERRKAIRRVVRCSLVQGHGAYPNRDAWWGMFRLGQIWSDLTRSLGLFRKGFLRRALYYNMSCYGVADEFRDTGGLAGGLAGFSGTLSAGIGTRD